MAGVLWHQDSTSLNDRPTKVASDHHWRPSLATIIGALVRGKTCFVSQAHKLASFGWPPANKTTEGAKPHLCCVASGQQKHGGHNKLWQYYAICYCCCCWSRFLILNQSSHGRVLISTIKIRGKHYLCHLPQPEDEPSERAC